MESKFIEIFAGLKRNYGYCNIKNGFKDPDTGKIKFKPREIKDVIISPNIK